MLHSEKPLPMAITTNDEIAREILLELRGLRDDLAGQVAVAVVPIALREPAAPLASPPLTDPPRGPQRKRS